MNAPSSGYLEIPAFDFGQTIQKADSGGQDVTVNFRTPPSDYLWHIQRISCTTSDGSEATWTVYVVGSQGTDPTAIANQRDSYGPSPAGAFVNDPILRVRDSEELMVRAEGLTAGAAIAVTIQALVCKPVSVTYDPSRLGLVGVLTT